MTFGETWGWGASKDESRKIFETFVEAGGNFFDTANVYTEGQSEKLLGEFIAADRQRFVVTTKYTSSTKPGDPNAAGNQRKNMVQSLEASLKRLGTDYVDLYLIHVWDPLTPIEELMRAFDDLVRTGKVLYIGMSDAPAWVIAQANTLAQYHGWTPLVALSAQYNLIDRTPERELLPMAETLDIAVTAWSPLAAGLLSGKYTGNETEEGNTSTGSAPGRLHTLQRASSMLTERNRAIIRVLQQVAHELGRTPSQVALGWMRVQSKAIIPIISATRASQIRDNLGCLDITLSPEQLHQLDEVSRISLDFPLGFLATTPGFVYGNTFEAIDSERRNVLLKAIENEK
jgi:aryl-alcohol dehydrogenase-like predicted oxidoreductase